VGSKFGGLQKAQRLNGKGETMSKPVTINVTPVVIGIKTDEDDDDDEGDAKE